ncbi:MAG TPA: ChaN family lipoprotein [Terriglobales bacterium]|nr:ChaN family lipoprotein [Terriglobales bacterium]
MRLTRVKDPAPANAPFFPEHNMATASTLRLRRSAAERHALEGVERDIRVHDPNGRQKYLRDYHQAYLAYQGVLSREGVHAQLRRADVILIADYHALPASQRFAAEVLERLSRESGRPVVLGVEFMLARDQHLLDRWLRGEIPSEELRARVRFDAQWGYEWAPAEGLLSAARAHAAGVAGLDCLPRHDLRRVNLRDRHAAAKIDELRERNPGAIVVALFGESHLAPNHIPHWLKERRPDDRILTVLQNVDALYWQAAGEPERVEAVRVEEDVVCVFGATPLEKYESYRMCIERWRQARTASPDPAPTLYNLIDALLRFLHINQYSPHNGTQPRYLVDLLPEVYAREELEALRKLLARQGAKLEEARLALEALRERGSCYLPRLNTIFLQRFEMAGGAEEAARFVHAACRGKAGSNGHGRPPGSAEDVFYTLVLEEALAYLGSRVLYPARPGVHREELQGFYAQPDPLLELAGESLADAAQQMGQMLGTKLYDSYLEARLTRRFLRSLYFRRLDAPGTARTLYFQTIRRLQS